MKATGRPIKRKGEVWDRLMFSLYRRDVDFLTRTEADIRLAHGCKIQRSAILRGILEGVEDSGLDLTQCADEDAIRALVAASIKAPKKKAKKGKK